MSSFRSSPPLSSPPPKSLLQKVLILVCIGFLAVVLVYSYIGFSNHRVSFGPVLTQKQNALISNTTSNTPHTQLSPTYSPLNTSVEPTKSTSTLVKNPTNSTLTSLVREPTKSSELSDRYPSTFDKIWIEVDTNTVLRRTAYYDTRDHFGRSVILISLHDDEKEPSHLPQLYGKVTMDDKTSFCAPVEDWKTNGEVMKNWHDVVLNHVLRIHLKDHPGIPKHVQVTKDSTCTESKLLPLMNVFYDKKEQNGIVFATCLQKALFGRYSPQLLINFIELNKFLGASYITAYFSRDLENPDELYQGVRRYIDNGLLEIIDWRTTKNRQDWMWDQGMAASASECIYRNLHRARYMSLHDIDEFLIPRKHLKWIDFLEDLKKQTDISKYASYAFANALFHPDGEPLKGFDANKCQPPSYLVRKKRNGEPEREHPKVMLDLQTTITAYCHDIKNWKDGLQKLYWVPDDIGLLHHYRRDIRGIIPMKWIHDNVMDNYTQLLLPVIQKHCIS